MEAGTEKNTGNRRKSTRIMKAKSSDKNSLRITTILVTLQKTITERKNTLLNSLCPCQNPHKPDRLFRLTRPPALSFLQFLFILMLSANYTMGTQQKILKIVWRISHKTFWIHDLLHQITEFRWNANFVAIFFLEFQKEKYWKCGKRKIQKVWIHFSSW